MLEGVDSSGDPNQIPTLAAPRNPKPLVIYTDHALCGDLLNSKSTRTLRFLGDLAAELRDSGFPEATVRVGSRDKGDEKIVTSFSLRGLGSEDIDVKESLYYDDRSDDLKIDNKEHEEISRFISYIYRVGLVGAAAVTTAAPLLAGTVLIVGSALLVGGGLFNFNNKPAALKAVWDFVASPTGHFLESRAAILGQVAKNLMVKAAQDPGTPLVLHPVRRTWALREIETRMQRAGLPLQIVLPTPPARVASDSCPMLGGPSKERQSPPAALPAPEADPLELLAGVDARANGQIARRLATRFDAAAKGIAEHVAGVPEPEVRQAAGVFLDLLTKAARVLPEERQPRPAARAEIVAASLRDYVGLPEDVRTAVKDDFVTALGAATGYLREEVERKNGATAEGFRASLALLKNDHL